MEQIAMRRIAVRVGGIAAVKKVAVGGKQVTFPFLAPVPTFVIKEIPKKQHNAVPFFVICRE